MDSRTATRQLDELLLPFLRTRDEAEAERLLALLVEEHAAPVARAVVKRKLRASLRDSDGRGQNQDALDVAADVYADLLEELSGLRAGRHERAIGNFRAYVAGVAYNACHRYLRRKYPERHSLKTRLRYLLTHHSDFALWDAGEHALMCGRAARSARPAEASDDHSPQDLAERARARLGGRDARRAQLWEVAAAVFDAAGTALELDELVNVVAELQGVEEQQPSRDEGEEASVARAEQLADSSAGVAEELEQRAYLARLWAEIGQLPPNQRAALLLNLRDAQGRDVTSLLPHMGVAGLRQIAEAVRIPAAEFAALWNELPLEDTRIAERLGLTRQQVINLRKSARARLGRRMREFEGG
jgi:RNA polymerase sigma factor (sigma-70 family)